MPSVCINTPGTKIRLVSERLEIQGQDTETKTTVLRVIPIRDVDRLIMQESVQISSEALSALLRQDIPVALVGWNGQYLGGFQPCAPAQGAWRVRQYQASLDSDFTLVMAGRIVAAKIYNQRRVLQRMAANRAEDITSALDYLGSLINDSSKATSVDELRGYEGAAAARYFSQWAAFLPEAFPFERRSTRPPLNPVNACISFGATLLYNEMVSFIHCHGLDPALGLLHTTEDRRWSLALDLLEPFRPVLVEALALDVFTHQILNAKHFRPHEGGIYLNDEGRAKFIVQYERRMERQFMSESVGHRTTLRQQLEAQAIQFKSSLADPAKFEPFLMN
jgi:CRISPR-associated endonuclease Cas1